jgi:colanic acid/amylovoran biosynthesis glycosyltransferase
LKIAYLVNRYPAASHSFIKREIAAIERAGTDVLRYSVRAADLQALPDAGDKAEYEKTIILLGKQKWQLISALLGAMLLSPRAFWTARKIAFHKVPWRAGDLVRRIAYLAEAAWLARELKAQGVGHLHAHFGTNPAMVARLAKSFGGPSYSFTVHGPDEFDQPEALDLKGKIADAAFCAAISSFGRGQLMRWCNFADWPKIEIIRCGVSDNFLNEKEVIPISDASTLCAVARLSAQKGIPLLIEAAARLRQDGVAFHLTLVGGGEMQQEMEALIAARGLHDCVQITGWASSEEVVQHIKASRAMVLPSFAEGLPVVIMEALALGRPVIASAIAGTPELVDEQCGWLVPSGSIDALTEAMKSALSASPSTLDAMGRVGRSRVLAKHDSSRNGEELLQLIQNKQQASI